MAPITLHVGGRTLVLVAGMPGAGKSTLLGTLTPDPAVSVLDSDAHRAALHGLLHPVPYALYRPLVHLWHRLSVVVAAMSTVPVVVVHLPATCVRTRTMISRLAAASGRGAHLLWCDVEPAEALRGQLERGREVPAASFERHARRAHVPAGEAGWERVTVVDRAGARAGLRIVVGSAVPGPVRAPARAQ